MSLLSSIQMGANALQAQQLGLQVVGQNIANANTPGYSVETLAVTPGPTQHDGSLLLGSGVEIEGVQAAGQPIPQRPGPQRTQHANRHRR